MPTIVYSTPSGVRLIHLGAVEPPNPILFGLADLSASKSGRLAIPIHHSDKLRSQTRLLLSL